MTALLQFIVALLLTITGHGGAAGDQVRPPAPAAGGVAASVPTAHPTPPPIVAPKPGGVAVVPPAPVVTTPQTPTASTSVAVAPPRMDGRERQGPDMCTDPISCPSDRPAS